MINLLRANDIFGNEITSKDSPGKALVEICLITIMTFITEVLPIKVAINKDFMLLFCKTKEVSIKSETVNNSKHEVILNISEANTDVSYHSGNNSLCVPEKPHLSFKEYLAKSISIDKIFGQIKDNIIPSADIKMNKKISNNKNSLGKIYNAEVDINEVKTQVSARVVTLEKIPSYLIESIYLEMAYYKENYFNSLTPILGLSCEPPTLFILSPWYELSLRKFIYGDETTCTEKLRTILYLF